MAPSHVTSAVPPRTSKGVETSVVTDPGVGIGLDRITAERGKGRPDRYVSRVVRGDVGDGITSILEWKLERPGELRRPFLWDIGEHRLR